VSRKRTSNALKAARRAAHAAFDPLWRQDGWDRGRAYRWLARHLGVSEAKCHIGNFNVETCRQVVVVCRRKREGIA